MAKAKRKSRNADRVMRAEVLKKAETKLKKDTRFQKGNQLRKGATGAIPGSSTQPIKILNRQMVNDYIASMIHMSDKELKAKKDHPDTPMIEGIICAIMLKSKNSADQWRLEFLLNRSIGKVKDEIEYTNPNPYAGWTTEQLIAERKRLSENNLKTLALQTKHLEITPSDDGQPAPGDGPSEPST